MSSVTVLAPNGRRQTVKCTPNTTILQVSLVKYHISSKIRFLRMSVTVRF